MFERPQSKKPSAQAEISKRVQAETSMRLQAETSPRVEAAVPVFKKVEEVAERYGKTPHSIWRWSRTAYLGFPAPIRLTPGCTRWRLSDLEAWEAQRAAAEGAVA